VTEFTLSTLPQPGVGYLYLMRDSLWLDPPYQREGGIWSLYKRQLLVDSVINGFDIPKIYLHELTPAKKVNGKLKKYAIVDGKQRLQTLWDFIDGEFALSPEFEYFHDDAVDARGCTYADLGTKFPEIKSRLDYSALHVVVIRTDDIEMIEDMFLRLNEAMPLNAPEKRNGFPGPLPKVIRALADHGFFSKHLSYTDRRYKHRDLAAKFLYIENADKVADTKKAHLDGFVKDWAKAKRTGIEAVQISAAVEKHLSRMSRLFTAHDPLLKSVGMATLYFHLFRLLDKHRIVSSLHRQHLELFDVQRQRNRLVAAEDLTKADADLLEFERHSQSPNDATAIKIRLSVLSKSLRENGVAIPRGDPYFHVDV